VGDELVAGVAELVGVALQGEVESALDLGAVDRRDRDGGAAVAVEGRRGSRIELLDDGEEIGEELFVLYGSFGLARDRWASESRSL
jgi:hypothetical protein